MENYEDSEASNVDKNSVVARLRGLVESWRSEQTYFSERLEITKAELGIDVFENDYNKAAESAVTIAVLNTNKFRLETCIRHLETEIDAIESSEN